MIRPCAALLALALSAAAGEPGFDRIFAAFDAAFPVGAARSGLKRQAFERALAARGPAPAIRAMHGFERALDEIRKRVDVDFSAYMKAMDKWWAWRRAYERDQQRRYKRPPAEYPVPDGLNRSYIAAELRFRESRSLALRERLFQERVVVRLAAALADESAAGKALPALAAGLAQRNPYQRLRCARLLGGLRDAGAAQALERALGREKHPVVLGALLDARGRTGAAGIARAAARFLDHPAWPVRAGAVLALRADGSPAAVAALEKRLEKETGRLRDDLEAALAAIRARGGPAPWIEPPEGAPEVPGITGKGPAEFLGLSTASRALVLCVDASVPEASKQVREEVVHALDTLPDGARFGLVAFDSKPHLFKRSLVPAGAGSRRAADAFLAGLEPDRVADASAGLSAALELAGGERGKPAAADTIWFLSLQPPRPLQNEPDRRRIVDARQIAWEVRRQNALRGIRIHCIGRSTGGESWWLQSIAKQFGGALRPLGR